MPRKVKTKLPENLSDFAGPDADRENIEKLAQAAGAANAKAGHNSGEPSPEVIRRNYDALKVCLLEIAAAGRVMQSARAAYGAARKTAKTDFGAKSWVESLVEALQDDMAVDKSGAGAMVSHNRQKAAVFKAVGSSLYIQLGFNFLLDDEAGSPGAPKSEDDLIREATLAGEHAGMNGEPVDNCPHQAGSPKAFGWRNGWQVGADKLTDSFRTGSVPTNGEAAAH